MGEAADLGCLEGTSCFLNVYLPRGYDIKELKIWKLDSYERCKSLQYYVGIRVVVQKY